MVTIAALWLPILLSAVAVFIVSSIIHMVLTYHNSDFSKLPNEDEIMDALRKFNIPAGNYLMPCATSNKERNTPEFKEKFNKGPVALITMVSSSHANMGKNLALWFLYCVIVGIFTAYIAGRAVAPGGEYLSVFRFAGCTAFLGYSMATMQNSIWYNRKWSTTFKVMFDGLIFGLITAGIFAWLWP